MSLRDKFYGLSVSDIEKITADSIAITFAVPPELEDLFRFKQGQYLTLKTSISGEQVRRPYSICSSALPGSDLQVAIKRVPHGLFSGWAHDHLDVGDTLDVMPPNGNFYSDLSSQRKVKYCCIAAGSGITPILSMIETTLHVEKFSQIVLLYGNKNENSIMFLENLSSLKNRFLDRLQIIHVLSREKADAELLYGRLGGAKVMDILAKIGRGFEVDKFFICGPNDMSIDIESTLLKSFSPDLILTESFGQTTGSRIPLNTSRLKDNILCLATIRRDGREFDLEIDSSKEESVLDAAIRQGLDLPYSCKAGACSTCRGFLLEGEVSMKNSYSLTDGLLESGYLLTCQAFPLTKKIKIDMDRK